MQRQKTPLLLLGVLITALGACQFSTDVLDERRCDSDDDCTGNFRCIEGICQGLLNEEDQDQSGDISDVDAPPDPCQDFDEDLVFAGVDCEATVIDCNDYDGAVFPDNDEICDGKDNDCDELVDEEDLDDYMAGSCPLSEGVCEGSHRECDGGTPVECTNANYGESFEVDNELSCDGLDNDCDGTVDEGIGRDCYSLGLDHVTLTVDGAPCAIGTEYCVEAGEGVFSGVCIGEVTPEDETDATEGNFELRCDGIDNDCDGDPDPACVCQPGQTQECYTQVDTTPTDHPPCQMGYRTCGEDSRFEDTCHDEVLPGTETCSNPGVDDDCNGVNTVDDIPGFGDDCTRVDLKGACRAGKMRCVGAELTCVPLHQPEDETCTNMSTGEGTGDDDCDGLVDNIPGLGDDCIVTSFGGQSQWGICQLGTMSCHDDVLVCVPGAATTESCNHEDDNCDHQVDNGVDTTHDDLHCGACDNDCPDGADDSATVCCDSVCVDKRDDPLHCGACGNTCPDGADAGAVTCCEVSGNGDCINLTTDADHCGGCDAACPHGDDPGTDTTCCPVQQGDGSVVGDCVNTQTDNDHCGDCGSPCAETQHCCGGTCVALDDPDHCQTCGTSCGDGTACCAGDSGFTCVDTGDDGNCGGCDVTCSASSLVCCAPGADAAGACVDTVTDMENCGGCNIPCTGGASPACCETDLGAGLCTDLDGNDSKNCGACGRECSGQTPNCCSGECTDLQEDDDNCKTCGHECGGETPFCCAGGCVDLTSDNDHCGECGNDCGDDLCCDGYCLDVDSCDGG